METACLPLRDAASATWHFLLTNRLPAALALPSRGVALVVLAFLTNSSPAQAPSLIWSTNVAGTLFSVDSQTNLYATAGSNVILLDSMGQALQTNSICPLPAVAQRDDAGNYYFAGSFDGLQDFGGVTLLGGCTNCSNGNWGPGTPSGFLAKYASDHSLTWVVRFGPNPQRNTPSSLALDPNGNCYVGYQSSGLGSITSFNSSGMQMADTNMDTAPGSTFAVKVGGATGSNCSFFVFRYSDYAIAGRMGLTGGYSWAGTYPLRWRSEASSNAVPIRDDLGSLFEVGQCFDPVLDPFCSAQNLRKYGPGRMELWSREVTTEAHWTLARDAQSNIYLAGTNGMFAKYDTDGNFIWSNNFSRIVAAMVVDASGNRFLSFADGGVARLAADPAAVMPTIVSDPRPNTVFVGDTVSLSVSASGTEPLRYFWRLNGANISGATTEDYEFNDAAASQAGNYTVVITNVAGAVTSAPALLRVKSVQFYLGSQMLTNGDYVFTSPPTLSIHSAFPSGSAFFTLDGSPPTFASAFYSGPFVVMQNATVRALGYNASFTQFEEADSVNIVVLANHTLATSASGGGSVLLNPPGGNYLGTNYVTATAVPAPGWSFLYWLGDAYGNNPVVGLTMERDKSIRAVFGTTLSTTVAGNGHVELAPPGGVYPYGTTVRLTGIPDPGSYFGFWGNAATGNTNPLYFSITAPTQTVSSIFGETPAGQVALTLLIHGAGRITASPRANHYALNQLVNLTATPDPGQSFLGWSGDALGTTNPLLLTMTVAKSVTANFTRRPKLQVEPTGLNGYIAGGFRFTLISEAPAAFHVHGSTDLTNWSSLGWLTNVYGEVQFTEGYTTNTPKKFYRTAP